MSSLTLKRHKTLKRHNSFQNKDNRKATHSFSPRPLIFKLQQEVLNFNDICASWSSTKTDQLTKFLNLEIEVVRILNNLVLFLTYLFL